jgi:DNA-directed RNA polymerase specialized sigma24 family protein
VTAVALANEPRLRTFGGYVWLPQVAAFEEIEDPRRRAMALRRAIGAVEQLLGELHTALDDAAVQMNGKGMTYEAIGGRCGWSHTTAHTRIKRRRNELARKEDEPAAEAA